MYPNFKELLLAFNANNVEYLIVVDELEAKKRK